jgi:hypothetical protein
MPTTKDVKRLPSGRIKYRGETFAGFNKPKRTPGKSKKSAVLAKKGSEIKLVRFGDPKMSIKKDRKGGAASKKSKGSKICPEGKAWAKRTFDTYPSAYANLAASKYCKDPNYAKKAKGGKRKGR